MFDLSQRRAFVRHPFQGQIVTSDLSRWLSSLSAAIEQGNFRPNTGRTVPVPKAQGQIRPGGELHLPDQVVYNALIQNIRGAIVTALGPANDSPDYSYQLRNDPAHVEWFNPFFAPWRAFDRDSIRALDDGSQFVVVADIAGYYENIDLNTLRSDLNGLGVDSGVLTLLMECLNRWPRIQRRGVPQGYSPSDLLAKLYLHPVDLTLRAEGYAHRRWVDDYRIFCNTEAEARRALSLLAEVLGRRGLVFQTAKSRVLRAVEARAKFNEVPALLDPIQVAVTQQIQSDGSGGASFLPPWEVDEALSQEQKEGALEVLRSALQTYFLLENRPPFNKSLFHYILRRLGAAEDATHADGVISLLQELPHEFDAIAEYCGDVGEQQPLEQRFLELLTAGLFPYPYLIYQFARWRLREDRPMCQELRIAARQWSFGLGQPWYVRSVARCLLGKLGDAADLESLEAAYAEAQSDIERAEILCALQRMEAGRRNALFGRAAGDGDLASMAIRLARNGAVEWEAC